jgi:hypothetical protein
MKLIQTTFLLSALATSFGASAAERLYFQVPVQYGPGIFAPQAVRDECELERHLADDMSSQVSKEYRKIELAGPGEDVGNEKVLKVTITNAWGAGGGAMTGPKSLQVLAELQQGGATLASNSFRRTTSMGTFRGTCGMFHKLTKELGEDVAKWLKNGATSGAAPAEPAPKAGE